MAETNFVQVNPTVANQENDAAYQADSFVTGGAASGSVFDSITANKLFYQLSTMTAALAQMMKNKGYSLLDGTTPVTPVGSPSAAVTALATVLANLLTGADLVVSAVVSNNTGDIVFGALLDNWHIQWGITSPGVSGVLQTTPFNSAFVHNTPAVFITGVLDSGSASDVICTPVIPSTFINLSQFNWVFDAPGLQFAILWLALGR